MWESGEETTINPELGTRNLGVQFTEFTTKAKNYDGDIYIRRLTPSLSQPALANVHSVVHAKPYDMDPIHWLDAGLGRMGIHRTDKKYWCSALVARVYQATGVLPVTTDWTALTPENLASGIFPLPPFSLGPPRPLKKPDHPAL